DRRGGGAPDRGGGVLGRGGGGQYRPAPRAAGLAAARGVSRAPPASVRGSGPRRTGARPGEQRDVGQTGIERSNSVSGRCGGGGAQARVNRVLRKYEEGETRGVVTVCAPGGAIGLGHRLQRRRRALSSIERCGDQ